ncbi:hypothetical protein LTR85_004898 [Meristemomyces frigidus]|nr:hypothetical protein LTR85_004898 [Meristemomyces frigidus]
MTAVGGQIGGGLLVGFSHAGYQNELDYNRCNIRGNVVGEKTFAYAPDAVEGAQMVKDVFGVLSLYKLQNLIFGIANGAIATSLTVLFVDGLTHINYW